MKNPTTFLKVQKQNLHKIIIIYSKFRDTHVPTASSLYK